MMTFRRSVRPWSALLVALAVLLGVTVSVTPAASAAVPDTWTGRTAPEANEWYSLTYGNGTFVAVAGTGTNRVMTSSDGITWTARAAAEDNYWLSVTYGNGLFVAVAPYGTNQVMTSPDGVTWTARAAAEARNWYSVTYGNGVFVAVPGDGVGTNRVMTSPDGITWTAHTATAENQWMSVTFGNGLFVAVSFDGTNRVMTSPDGITWTARAAAAASYWRSVTYGGGTFVAVALMGTGRVMTSPDGVNWTGQAAEASFWFSVVYGNGRFVAVAPTGTNQVMTSSSSAPSRPAVPTRVRATPGDGSASISFIPGSDGGSPITKYQYRVGSGAWTDAVETGSPITVSGLNNYTDYRISVRAVNAVGNSPAGGPVKVRPRYTGPVLDSAVAASPSSITASFSGVLYGGVNGYRYLVSVVVKGTTNEVGSCRTSSSGRSCSVTGLSPDTEYDVSVTHWFKFPADPNARTSLPSNTRTVRTAPSP